MTSPNPTGREGLVERLNILARQFDKCADVAMAEKANRYVVESFEEDAETCREAADRIEALEGENRRLRPIPSEFEEMFGVVYRTGPPTEADYDEAIEALRNAREAYIFGDSMGCRVCEDSGHGANQCHHNPLLIARKWAAASQFYQCWHCGFVATNEGEAREHFGKDDCNDPSCIDALRSALTTSQARVAELERALRPFAKLAQPLHPIEEPNGPSVIDLMTADGSDELQLKAYVGPSGRFEILDADDFRHALAELEREREGQGLSVSQSAAQGTTALPPPSAEPSGRCSDCPPIGYPTDETRCWACPRRIEPMPEPVDFCKGDGEPCFSRRSRDPLDWHWRCGTVQCPFQPHVAPEAEPSAADILRTAADRLMASSSGFRTGQFVATTPLELSAVDLRKLIERL